MADNETTGSGKAVATDKVTYSGDADQNLQLMRLVHVTGSEGSKTVTEIVAATDAAYSAGDPGLLIHGVRNDANASRGGTDGDRVPIGMSAAGHVMTYRMADLQKIAVTSGGLTTATTSYTAGDQVGNQFTIAGAARASGGGGVIVGCTLISAADIIGAYDVVFFDSSVTLASDNAAFSISDSDALNLVGVCQLVGAYDIGSNRIAQAFNLAIPYVCSGGTSLYAGLICRGGHTFFGATTDLQLNVFVERY